MKHPMGYFLLFMGHFFENLYRVPGRGDSLVRGLGRGLAKLLVSLPFTGYRRSSSVEESIALLRLICGRFGADVDIVKQDGDGFEFEVPACPYGYKHPHQQGVCDAVMDLDRAMYKHCGLDLTIIEAAVTGAPRCRIAMRQL